MRRPWLETQPSLRVRFRLRSPLFSWSRRGRPSHSWCSKA